MSLQKSVTVTLDKPCTQATLRIDGISRPIIAPVLGVEPVGSDAPQTIYLASLVHRVGDPEYAGWSMSGAVSTILTRRGA